MDHRQLRAQVIYSPDTTSKDAWRSIPNLVGINLYADILPVNPNIEITIVKPNPN